MYFTVHKKNVNQSMETRKLDEFVTYFYTSNNFHALIIFYYYNFKLNVYRKMFPMFPRICSKFEADQTSGSDFRTKKRKKCKNLHWLINVCIQI